MQKIKPKEKKRRSIGFRILVAAAILSGLTVTAFAAEEILGAGDWFREIMNIRLKEYHASRDRQSDDSPVQETLGENQVAIVNQMGQVFEQKRCTSHGTTIVMTAAYADANVVHVNLQAEVPKGTVLPDGIEYAFESNESFSDIEMSEKRAGALELGEGAPYSVPGFTYEVEALPDEEPTDNRKDFHLTVYKQAGCDLTFNDGVAKYWHIDGIYQQVIDKDGDEDGFIQLAPGEFVFDISLANSVEVVDLNVDGLSYGGHKERTWTHASQCDATCQEYLTGQMDPETGLPVHCDRWEYSVTPKCLRISPLSVEWECVSTVSNERICPGLCFRIVMKDGTSPVGKDIGGSIGENRASGTLIYDVPIDLEAVDYILIGDEELESTHKVSLP